MALALSPTASSWSRTSWRAYKKDNSVPEKKKRESFVAHLVRGSLVDLAHCVLVFQQATNPKPMALVYASCSLRMNVAIEKVGPANFDFSLKLLVFSVVLR